MPHDRRGACWRGSGRRGGGGDGRGGGGDGSNRAAPPSLNSGSVTPKFPSTARRSPPRSLPRLLPSRHAACASHSSNGVFEEWVTVRTRRSRALTSTRPVGTVHVFPLPLPQRFPGGGTCMPPALPCLAQAPPVQGDRRDVAEMGKSARSLPPQRGPETRQQPPRLPRVALPLQRLGALPCPRDLDPLMRAAGGLWEPGGRRWLITRPLMRELRRATDPLFRQAGIDLDG